MTTQSSLSGEGIKNTKIEPTEEELQAEQDALGSAQQAEEEAKGQWEAEQQQFEDEHGHDEGGPDY